MRSLKTFSPWLASILVSIAVTSPLSAQTVGPNGEQPTPAASIQLDDAEIDAIKGSNLTAALVWHEMSEYTDAVNRGAQDEFKRLGIEIIAQTDAGFDTARQRADVETVMAKNPSIILSLPVDPTSAAAVYNPARDAGVTLAFVDNAPTGYVHGKDYVTIVSDDLFQMGKKAADAMATALGGKGKVGYIFHDADFYVTNQRDNAFKTTIEKDYPDISITAEAGISDPALGEEIAHGMLIQNPDLDGIYVTWAEPALGALAVLRSMGNKDTKIVTLDLNEPAALDMISGGNFAAIVADEAYNIGVTAARAAAANAANGKSAPPFLVVDSLAVTKDNILDGWKQSLSKKAPATIVNSLK